MLDEVNLMCSLAYDTVHWHCIQNCLNEDIKKGAKRFPEKGSRTLLLGKKICGPMPFFRRSFPLTRTR